MYVYFTKMHYYYLKIIKFESLVMEKEENEYFDIAL